ncbi:CotS family spore coat protein [Brevibacillus sp. H7]|uniref:CotS family spore coat protein n=1 Tax=Brevibacillus sp. H7 TaxID=3349138 RepID=UPI0037FF69A4
MSTLINKKQKKGNQNHKKTKKNNPVKKGGQVPLSIPNKKRDPSLETGGSLLNEILIQPWGTSEDDLTLIPPEVEQLAKKAIQHYDMKVHGMTLITSKPDKGGAIWKINTSKGLRGLKLLHRPPSRSLFSVAAQDYLIKQGARVPPLIPDKKGELSVELGGKLWIVTKWIDTLTQATKIDLSGAKELCYGLGEFHKLSKGYKPPREAERESRLYRWPNYYQKIITKIDWFKKIATVYHDTPASPTLLSVVDGYHKQAVKSLAQLQQSPYAKLVSRGEEYWGLAHQDYGWSNGQLGPGGVWIIDLDGVAYDLPIRDLSKLITGTMDDLGGWDVPWILGMIDAYHQANPIEPELFQLLMVDLAFPSSFYKQLKEMVYDPAAFLNIETDNLIKRMIHIDNTKRTALKAIKNWRGK